MSELIYDVVGVVFSEPPPFSIFYDTGTRIILLFRNYVIIWICKFFMLCYHRWSLNGSRLTVSCVFSDSPWVFHLNSFIHYLNVAHRQGKRQNNQPTDSDDNTVTAVQRRYHTLWHGHDIWNSEIMYIIQQYIDTILFPCHMKLPLHQIIIDPTIIIWTLINLQWALGFSVLDFYMDCSRED